MKNKILILIMLVGLFVSAQQEKFEGLWSPINGTTWYTVITHNKTNNKLHLFSWSFEDNSIIEEHIVKKNKNSIFTKLENLETDWKVWIKYTILNDTIMLAKYNGSTKIEIQYEKLLN